ncbi:hypothetical protein MTR_3g099230 [Medicago truncatula]|uniref:Uncharacterized protein n=1 Tax=Medicago truncatula TaxID=3880 RepID=G7J3W5_MEDTR|nr:hypothetical protein MTR_3g099230 [Medicago truncatula]
MVTPTKGNALMIELRRRKKERGGRQRPRKTIRETIMKDFEINDLEPNNMVYDRTLWHNLIHVAGPT